MKIRFIKTIIVIVLTLSFQIYFLPAQEIKLVWTVNTNPTISHYGIYRTTHLDSSFIMIDTVNHPDSIYVDNEVRRGTHYYYVATSIDQSGNESGFSNMVDTTIDLQTPVELTGFAVEIIGNDAILTWSTVTESNNNGFEIQRRKGKETEFVKIGFVKGNGTTAIANHYQFIDQDLAEDYYAYRLKQMDYNGAFYYSDIVTVSPGQPHEVRLHQNFPNPFNASTSISYSLPMNAPVQLTVYDVNGQLVNRLVNKVQEAGQYCVTWDGRAANNETVSSGTYYYKIEVLEYAKFRKMIYLK